MTLQLKVANMACCACVNTITKAIKTVDPGAKVTADPQTKLVKVETEEPQDRIL
ncbi:MAG TPA: heavy metal transporter [Cyanobacteria bacterium UBA11369]|nr:heavy metal transporter [Cyanobacteria bacterium UBA11371]HBE30493.1 heavy metal transporter [Cyanobacteria bacterium UBA11368]HBE54446.1 heavy metal transporter [Cyanobacteria bacterium UBA11369]